MFMLRLSPPHPQPETLWDIQSLLQYIEFVVHKAETHVHATHTLTRTHTLTHSHHSPTPAAKSYRAATNAKTLWHVQKTHLGVCDVCFCVCGEKVKRERLSGDAHENTGAGCTHAVCGADSRTPAGKKCIVRFFLFKKKSALKRSYMRQIIGH